MAKKKKETIEYRYFEIPQKEMVLAFLGARWNTVYGHDELHQHFHNLMEIGYCRRGEGNMYFDEQKLHYSTSMLTVIPANYPHMTVSDGENTNFWEYLFFNPERIIHDIYPDNSICQREMIELVNRRAMIMHESDDPKLVDIVKTISLFRIVCSLT